MTHQRRRPPRCRAARVPRSWRLPVPRAPTPRARPHPATVRGRAVAVHRKCCAGEVRKSAGNGREPVRRSAAGSGRRRRSGRRGRPGWRSGSTASRPARAATARSRPYRPPAVARGVPGPARPSSGTCQSRSPRSAATYRVEPAIVAPLGEASEVGQVTSGAANRGSSRGALHDRPAVVLAGLDQVHLVEPVLPELAGPQPAGPSRRPAPARCGGPYDQTSECRTGCPAPAARPGSSAGSCRRASRRSCDRPLSEASPVPA